MKKEEQNEFFETWKEIAHFLDVNVRTCQRWEKEFGLPVYRHIGAEKSRVFAKKNELILFQKELRKRNNCQLPSPPQIEAKDRTDKNRHFYNFKNKYFRLEMGVGAILILVLSVVAGYSFFKIPVPPANFKIVDNTLSILDSDGNELWSYNSGKHHLERESAYRRLFIKGNMHPLEEDLPWLKMIDLDGDGEVEVLYCVVNKSMTDSELVVFNADGNIRFRYNDWKAVRTDDEEFSADYKIKGVDCCDFDNDGNMEILLIALHQSYYPCQVLVFNHKGRKLGEYWHSGFLTSCRFVDLNGDGIEEIILGGTNNEFTEACLVVLDPFNIKGCSPQQSGRYRFHGFPRGTELYYVRFPRTDIDLAEGALEAADRLLIQKNNRIQVRMQKSSLYYELDFQLKCLPIGTTNDFSKKHIKLKSEGRISSNVDQMYLKEIREKIVYYDGEAWSSTPTPVIYRK
jgi:hypothetical protein